MRSSASCCGRHADNSSNGLNVGERCKGKGGLFVKIDVRRCEYKDVEALRELYRAEARCQIWADSSIRRGYADPYLIFIDERLSGYGGVYNQYDPGRLTEFYVMPFARERALPMFREFLASQRGNGNCGSNQPPLLLMMLYDCASEIRTEKILFADAFTSELEAPGGCSFRASTASELAEQKGRGAAVSSPGSSSVRRRDCGRRWISDSLQSAVRGCVYGSAESRAAARGGELPGARSEADLLRSGTSACGAVFAGECRLAQDVGEGGAVAVRKNLSRNVMRRIELLTRRSIDCDEKCRRSPWTSEDALNTAAQIPATRTKKVGESICVDSPTVQVRI